ncbi:S100P-binding protein isoform 1-T2 [Discoglossus pictus]
MKHTSNQTSLRPHADRQVLLLKKNSRVSQVDTTEDIRVSIMNDRATATKRDREDPAETSPCSKRLCSIVINCSTPHSASRFVHSASTLQDGGTMQNHGMSPTSSRLFDDFDDSLLEPSDNEIDSPLHMTLEEVEELLQDDDDDACYAAEPPTWDDDSDLCKSEDIFIQHTPSPCKQLKDSSILNEQDKSDLETTIYAAMTPSPSYSPVFTVELDAISIDNSCNRTLRAQPPCKKESTFDGGPSLSPIPLPTVASSKTELDTLCQGTKEAQPLESPELMELVTLDQCSEDSEKTFDSDIDQHLLPSDGDILIEEEGTAEAPSTLVTVSEDSLHQTVSCPKISTAPQNNLPVLRDGQEMEPSKLVAVTDTEGDKGEGTSITHQDHPTSKAPTSKPNELLPTQVVAPVKFGKNVLSAPSQGKKLETVNPLQRPASRLLISSYDLEVSRNNYRNRVMMHLEGPSTSEDPHYELASLLNQISRDNPKWQHPSDFTRRNHPRCGRKLPTRCSLGQWVQHNGGFQQRFKGLPATFQRSPIPEVPPSVPL